MKAPGVFRSLRGFNYRVWIAGAFVSNVGTWVQRTAQDWLVLTQLTHHDASTLGLVMALQFGPQILLLPWTGFAADHFNQRKLLIADSGRSRPPFRDEAARHSEIIPPTVPR
jgi:Transmembrane secretion effector